MGTTESRPLRRFDGRVCLVTGSTGIAAAAARRFAAEGARVFVVSLTDAHCADLVRQLAGAGAEAAYVAVDLTTDAAAVDAVAACAARFGRIDGVFNVAGGSGRRFGDGPVHEATPAGWDATLDLNARSLFLVCRAAVGQMLSQEPDADGSRGAILNMSSVLATSPSPRYFATHAYAAAKGAIESLTRAMAASYAAQAIRVNAVAPSLTLTPMAGRAAGDPETQRYATWKQPLVGGFLDAEDISGAAAFLLSGDSRAITGQVLAIDGGWSVTEAP